MEDIYVKIKLNELNSLKNRIKGLERQVKTLGIKDDHSGKRGPKCALDYLPVVFKEQEAYDYGVTTNCLRKWKWRGYVNYDGKETYTKTKAYIDKSFMT